MGFFNFQQLQNIPPVVLFILAIWVLAWKGLALWKAAKLNQREWFIAVLVLNTLGILEIIYLYFFSRKKATKEGVSA